MTKVNDRSCTIRLSGEEQERDAQVSETVASLGELLDSADEVVDGPTSYLIGQLAAELIGSASDAELSRLIVAAHRQSGSSDREVAPPARQSLLSMLSGLLQGVLGDRESAGRAGSPLTVRERVLNLLAIEPRNPKSLSSEIGCSMATASRALRRLHDNELVEKTSNPDLADGRYVMYQLTDKGEKRQEDRFFGQLEDDPVSEGDYEDDGYDYGQSLTQLTQLVAELNNHDPAIAAELCPALDAFKDRVDDPELRAAALGELSVLSRSRPDLVSAERSHDWVDEFIALAQDENPLIAARAYYERARWTMRYHNSDDSSIEGDLTTAQKHAAEAGGPEGAYRNAWCLYQRASRALWRRDWTQAESLARSASTQFANVGDHHGWLTSQIVAARAELALGEVTAAADHLAEVVESAKRYSYKRQLADGLFWWGQAKIWIDDDDARETLDAAAKLYSELGDQDWSAVAKSSAETALFIAGEMNAKAARSLRKELEKTSAEIEKSTDTLSSLAHYWKAASINRRIGVLSAVAGDNQRADEAWDRAVAGYQESDSPEGIAVTMASYWLAQKTDPTQPSADVPSGDDMRAIAEHWELKLPDRTIDLAVEEVSRVQSEPEDSFKHLLDYA